MIDSRADVPAFTDPARRALWVWGPVVLWLLVISITSGNSGARTHADLWIWRVLHEWLPRLLGLEASTGAAGFLPGWVRKLAHVTEYGILGFLTTRAWWLWRRSDRPCPSDRRDGERGGRGPSRAGEWAVPATATAFCAVVAILDELHQHTLPSRTGSPRDVLIDVLGATSGAVIALLVWRRR